MVDELLDVEPQMKEDEIVDCVADIPVKATPEEVEAVQPFARRLMEEFGYPKSHLRTRPQFRVKEAPSGQEKWPVDIAVFHSSVQTYENTYMVVECKRKTRKDGLRQLQIYLNLCNAEVGVWTNGKEHLYIKKVKRPDGSNAYKEIPTIPRYGQPLSDIGKLKCKDLTKAIDLKSIFKDIRNHLAGMATGATRDEELAMQLINVLFVKLWDEWDKGPEEFVHFRADDEETAEQTWQRVVKIFNDKVKTEYKELFGDGDVISLDADSMRYVVGELQNYSLLHASREAIGEAFETFIGPALRGSQGQFFTPRNVIHMMVDILDPQPGEYIIDPACGSGGFLVAVLDSIWGELERIAPKKGWDKARLRDEQRKVADRYLRGIDKDASLAKIARGYLAILRAGRNSVFCENSLVPPDDWSAETKKEIRPGTFDVVLTNPPFGSKIKVEGEHILAQFQLGRRWEKDDEGNLQPTGSLYDTQTPQILFIERCLQLLKDGGRMGIVLPESIFGMPKYRYVVEYLKRHTRILGIVSMPEDLFQPHTHAKTCIVFVKKEKAPEDYPFFMAVARWCGHDSRGNPTMRKGPDGKMVLLDDVPLIAKKYLEWKESKEGVAA